MHALLSVDPTRRAGITNENTFRNSKTIIIYQSINFCFFGVPFRVFSCNLKIMNKKTRRAIVLALFFIFLLGGAYLLLSVYGLVLDAENFKIVKTGSIYLNSNPSDAKIIINGKPQKNTSNILNPGTLIKHLVPGAYSVAVRKQGYTTWKKTFSVTSGIVSSASRIMLWPEKFSDTPLADFVTNFQMTARGPVTETADGVFFLSDKIRGTELYDADLSSDFVLTKEKGIVFLTDIGNLSVAINVNELFASLRKQLQKNTDTAPIANIEFAPSDKQKLLIGTKRALYALNTKNITLEELYENTGTTLLGEFGGNVFATDEENIIRINLASKVKLITPIASPPLRIAATANRNKILTLDGAGILSLLDVENPEATSTPIAKNVTEFALSPEEKRVAILRENHTLSVYHLEDYFFDGENKKGTVYAVPLPVEQQLADIVWIPSLPNYVLVRMDGNLIVSEIDSRTPINWHILSKDVKKFTLRKKDVYILKTDGMFTKIQLF